MAEFEEIGNDYVQEYNDFQQDFNDLTLEGLSELETAFGQENFGAKIQQAMEGIGELKVQAKDPDTRQKLLEYAQLSEKTFRLNKYANTANGYEKNRLLTEIAALQGTRIEVGEAEVEAEGDGEGRELYEAHITELNSQIEEQKQIENKEPFNKLAVAKIEFYEILKGKVKEQQEINESTNIITRYARKGVARVRDAIIEAGNKMPGQQRQDFANSLSSKGGLNEHLDTQGNALEAQKKVVDTQINELKKEIDNEPNEDEKERKKKELEEKKRISDELERQRQQVEDLKKEIDNFEKERDKGEKEEEKKGGKKGSWLLKFLGFGALVAGIIEVLFLVAQNYRNHVNGCWLIDKRSNLAIQKIPFLTCNTDCQVLHRKYQGSKNEKANISDKAYLSNYLYDNNPYPTTSPTKNAFCTKYNTCHSKKNKENFEQNNKDDPSRGCCHNYMKYESNSSEKSQCSQPNIEINTAFIPGPSIPPITNVGDILCISDFDIKGGHWGDQYNSFLASNSIKESNLNKPFFPKGPGAVDEEIDSFQCDKTPSTVLGTDKSNWGGSSVTTSSQYCNTPGWMDSSKYQISKKSISIWEAVKDTADEIPAAIVQAAGDAINAAADFLGKALSWFWSWGKYLLIGLIVLFILPPILKYVFKSMSEKKQEGDGGAQRIEFVTAPPVAQAVAPPVAQAVAPPAQSGGPPTKKPSRAELAFLFNKLYV